MKIMYDEKSMKELMDRIVARTMKMDMIWDWPCGVAYYGIGRCYEVTGDTAYMEAMKARVDELIELGLPHWTVNACAMGHCVIDIWQYTKDDRYKEILLSMIGYLQHDALRFGDHVLQHTVSVNNDFPEQAWADTLFMAAFFMLRFGILENDRALVDDALHQYYWHIQYLQDPLTMLWYHGYDNIAKDHMSGFYWGRANAWAAYTMSQVALRLPECYLYPDYLEVANSLSEQLTALKAYQTENGLWRTIIDDPESYEEISASAGIAAAMAVQNNPLHTKYVRKAYEGLLANVAQDGRVMNVSGGTAVMRDREGYRTVPKKWIQGWGQGLALALLAEIIACGVKADKAV